MTEAPIFIGGLYKSGTTLLRMMLSQHPSIASGPETNWFDLNWEEIGQPSNRDYKGRLWNLRRDGNPMTQIEQLSKIYGFNKNRIKEITQMSSSREDFIDNFMSEYTKRLGKRRWLEKTPANILCLKKIFSKWPEAKVIHVYRDPKDIYASLKEEKIVNNVMEFVSLWSLFNDTPEKDKKCLKLSDTSLIEVHYEEIIFSTEIVMRKILDFIGEKWVDTVATFGGCEEDYHKVISVYGKASDTLDRLRNPLLKNRVGIWKKIITDDELDYMVKSVETNGLKKLFVKAESKYTL
jgi:hypothetical protein|tara:strand:+ start:868 stop:1746 length:879 start_codon:yes stop_codon:yes gene_type:complete